jgi:hypothetical protein
MRLQKAEFALQVKKSFMLLEVKFIFLCYRCGLVVSFLITFEKFFVSPNNLCNGLN